VLVVLMLAGALIRHSFVARHRAHVQGRPVPWGYAGAGVALLVGLVVLLAPRQPVAEPKAGPAGAAAEPVGYAQVRAVIEQRCAMCHNAAVQQKNVALHTPELIQQHRQSIYQQVAVLKLMPLNNATQMTDDERALIKRWFDAPAR